MYWERASVWRTEDDCSEYIIKWLVKAKHQEAAIQMLANAIMNNKELNMELVGKVLEQQAEYQDTHDSMTTYYISKIISWLQSNCTDKEKVALIEWQYFSILEDECKPKTLFTKIAKQPKFFIKLICMVYSNKNDAEIEEDNPAKITREKLISHVWYVLHEWNHMPGTQENGTFDAAKMNKWIDDVKNISQKVGCYEVAMQVIGKVAFYAQEDTDGFFINNAVAEILNAKDSVHQRKGFEIEAYNARGVHWVDATGKEERDIADTWDEKAEQAEKRSYIRFAKSLRNVAKNFRYDGRRNIVEQKQYEMEYD